MRTYEIIATVSNEIGKKQWKIRHTCGQVLLVYVWSFAGRGKICPGCKEKIRYVQF